MDELAYRWERMNQENSAAWAGGLWSFAALYRQLGDLLSGADGSVGSADRALPIDVVESDEAYVIEVELPGIGRDDVHVDVIANEVRVHGEIRQRETHGTLRHHTRRVGSFDNQVALPTDVDAGRTEATLAYGVLTVRAPKGESSEPHVVEIRVDMTEPARRAGVFDVR